MYFFNKESVIIRGIYIYIYTHTHTYTYIYMYVCVCVWRVQHGIQGALTKVSEKSFTWYICIM